MTDKLHHHTPSASLLTLRSLLYDFPLTTSFGSLFTLTLGDVGSTLILTDSILEVDIVEEDIDDDDDVDDDVVDVDDDAGVGVAESAFSSVSATSDVSTERDFVSASWRRGSSNI